MPEPDLIQPPLESKASVDPEDPEVNEPGPFAVLIERPLSGVRARLLRRPTLHLALAPAVPAWKLTAFALAVVVAFVFFGFVPALLVVPVLLLGELIFRFVWRARIAASLGTTSSLPPSTPTPPPEIVEPQATSHGADCPLVESN